MCIRDSGYAQEPLTHTGLMAATEITEGLSVSLAIVDGFDDNVAQTGDSSGHSDFGYVLGAALTVPDSLGFLGGSSLYVGYVDGKDAGNFGLFNTGAADADGNPIQAPNVENELLYIGASVNTPIEGVAIGIAYETVQLENGSLPLLLPMSEIAGRLSVHNGAKCLEHNEGGRGVLISGTTGVEPATVTILGAGIVGSNACKLAAGLGANVNILDININRHFYFTKFSIPLLKSNNGGTIINLSSTAGLFGFPLRSPYAALSLIHI